ncbi:tellurium resistance protein TerD [Cryobacterium psychrophilum]|nr:tellurium resistance protein TerD [Cryobacterium psychrophilum]
MQAGGNAPLTAENPLLIELLIGFGWTTIASGAPDAELVPSAILCDSAGNAVSPDSMVFFNQLSTPDDAVRYTTKGDQEQIEVNLSLVPDTVSKIVFVVYVDPDIRKPGSFSTVRNAYIRVAGRDDKDLLRFDLERTDATVTAMIFGELYRYKSEWKFRALGDGFTTGIDGVARSFGLAL